MSASTRATVDAAAVDARLALLRLWALRWLGCADASICEQILAPDYRISIGGYQIEGRDAYVEATLAQVERFPGLGITIHEVLHGGERVALRFTQHGTSRDRHDVAWVGVAIFTFADARLRECFAEEDYLGRRRQLRSADADPVEPPLAAPWSTQPGGPDPRAERAVREWLARDGFPGVACDAPSGSDAAHAPAEPRIEDATVELDTLFSSGSRVAFHGSRSGRYAGGLPDAQASVGAPATMHFAGIVAVEGDAVVGGRVVRDRLGLDRALRAQEERS